ncbi:MAG TPA: cbb3-type cytochrome c oxidase subunit I [Candidatus Limnocylindrales bacterium]|nr:cbb3-type cytochrome c oxidase subunit I [Candidatus Limnocylindrales bacterium]
MLAVGVIAWQTSRGGSDTPSLEDGVASSLRLEKSAHRADTTDHFEPKGGPFCFIRFGTLSFVLSSLMLIAMACPRISRVTEFTWFGPAQTQLQLYGFFAMTMFGAIYHLLPRVVGFEFPFPKLARVHFWISLSGVVLLVLPLAIGGVEQGLKLNHPDVGFMDALKATLPYLRVSTIGLMLLLFGNLLFMLNIFGLAFIWEISVVKKTFAAVTAPLETEGEAGSVSASLRRDQGEVKA